MICSVEEKTATAQYEHLTGAYFRYNDTLYVATTYISKGDTIVPNVNCRTTDVATSLGLERVDISCTSDSFKISSTLCYRKGGIVSLYILASSLSELSVDIGYLIYITGLPESPVHTHEHMSYWKGKVYDTMLFYGDDTVISVTPTISNFPNGIDVLLTYDFMCK